jgi:LCP family protein required for cell wall assembly
LRRTWPQRLLIAFNVCLILLCLVMAGGLGYFYSKVRDIPRVSLDAVLTPIATDTVSVDGATEPATTGAENFLIVGTDSAEGLDPDDPVLIGREDVALHSDTIMVLRVDSSTGEAWILSLPRDLWLPIAGTDHRQRINTAVQGGPEQLIQTVKDYFNIPIQHYVAIDFVGFKSLVEAVDGVPVYFPDPVRDLKSGLSVPDAGCVNLTGDQALAFARARAYQTYEDGRWHTDPTGDLGRISRQQDFIRRALKRAVAKGVRDPRVLNDLINVGIDSVTLDDRLTPGDLVDLGRAFRSFNPDTLQMYSVPVVDDTIGGAAVVLMLEDEAQPILDIFRGTDPGALQPSSVRIKVENGTGTAGEAAAVSEDLRSVGFQISGTGDADAFDFTRTTVRFVPGNRDAAELVARYIDPAPVLTEVPYLSGGQVVVITSSSYGGVLDAPRDVPSTTTTTSESAEPTSSTTSTSTTVIGEVPAEPPPDVHC